MLTGLLGLVAAAWLAQATRSFLGTRRLPVLSDVAPLAVGDCPFVSILFSARDEAEKLPSALATMLSQDYPRYEVIAVDDRSTDATGSILVEAASRDPRLTVIRLTELPPGWLGKTHGLQKAFEASRGELLVFTDADVRFAPDLLHRAASLQRRDRLDHLTLLGDVEMVGFWEKVAITYFALALYVSSQTWKVSDRRSKCYMGAGSFQLISRAAYETIGTHRRLALEVIDDMKLGKLVKMSDLRSQAGIAHGLIAVRWHAGLGNIIRGTTKNFFAASGFSLLRVVWQVAGVLLLSVFPFAAIVATDGPARAAAIVAALVPAASHAGLAHRAGAAWPYGLTHPIGCLLMVWMLIRSTAVTLWRGGIEWRGTFYPLEALRRGAV